MQIEDDRFKPNHINNYTIFNVLNPPIMKERFSNYVKKAIPDYILFTNFHLIYCKK